MMSFIKYRNGLIPFFCCVLASTISGCAIVDAGKSLFDGLSESILGSSDPDQAPTPLTEFKSELEIDMLWREDNGIGSDEFFLKLITAVGYGNIYTADHEGLFIARESATGNLVWKVETDYAFSAGPATDTELAVLGTSDAEVVAFSMENGEQQWKTQVSSEILATPVMAKKIVIVRTIDGKIVALSKVDGSQLWTFERSVPALSIRGTSTPLIIEDHVIVGYANGKMVALRLSDGKNVWETSIAVPGGRSEVDRLVDLDADPVASDGVIFVASYQAGTSAVLEIDGDVLWRNDNVSSYTGLGLDWRYIYLSDAESNVWQLDQRNGASLWKQTELRYRRLTPPVAYDDYVVVGDFEGYLHWLAASDGRFLARIKVTDAAIQNAPVVVDKTVFVYAQDGTLAAYKARVF